jgi:hypothetical protein
MSVSIHKSSFGSQVAPTSRPKAWLGVQDGCFDPIAVSVQVCESSGEAMRRRMSALGLAAVIAGGAACSSGHRTDPTKTTSTTSTSFSPTGANPDVIPSVITPAYVDAVFNVLEHIDGNASRALIASNAVTPTVLADIRAIYNDPLYAQEVEIAHQSLQGSLSNVKRPPGDVRITVSSLISGSRTCIFVRTTSDYTAVLLHPGPAVAAEYWALTPKVRADDPSGINPTEWALSFNVDFPTPTTVPNQCGG